MRESVFSDADTLDETKRTKVPVMLGFSVLAQVPSLAQSLIPTVVYLEWVNSIRL